MQIPPLSLAALLTTAVASAQVATSAQLVSGIVVAGSNSSAALQPGAEIWPGLVRSVESLANGATLLLDHHQDAVEVALHWQLTCQAINNGNSVARVEACYELVSPVVQGGELIVEGHYGAQSVKLAAGSAVVYASTSLHQVTPVTRGARVASFFWVQSMLRDAAKREMLFDLDQSIQSLGGDLGANAPDVVRLTGIYHNLIRQWAEV